MKKHLLTSLCDIALITSLLYLLSIEFTDRSCIQNYRISYFVPTDKPSANDVMIHFNGPDLLKEIGNKKFVPISLTGDMIEDEKRFEFIQWKARELKYTNDTTHILKVHLTEAITYGKFVRLLNLMLQDQHKRFFEFRDDFYIFGEPSGTEIESVIL